MYRRLFYSVGNSGSVKTRWNASYNSWVRLLKLRKSIEWLANTLPYEPGKDSKSDARRLKYLLLKNYEWELLEKILSLLKPFEEATTFFSVKFACGEEQDGKEFDISVPNLNNVALNFQRKIYNSLFDYWDKTSDLGLLATILDPLNENSSNLSETSRYSSNFFESIFDNEEHDEISEVDKYLDLQRMSEAPLDLGTFLDAFQLKISQGKQKFTHFLSW
ncbi:9010_t:CDS:2 [Entrophospora sp. SA101]|nr:9010_t:CDS:2 [Entrophospora sp. SA101]